jgi:hypothetical protein
LRKPRKISEVSMPLGQPLSREKTVSLISAERIISLQGVELFSLQKPHNKLIVEDYNWV